MLTVSESCQFAISLVSWSTLYPVLLQGGGSFLHPCLYVLAAALGFLPQKSAPCLAVAVDHWMIVGSP